MENDVILSCAGIRKSYTYVPVHSLLQDRVLRWPTVRRERRTLRVLCGIDIAVCRGEWVGITGPNGGGKTTLLSILAGLLPADEGSVERRGELSCFFGLGMGFHGERNAAENVAIHSLLNGIRRRDIGELTERIVAFAGLAAHREVDATENFQRAPLPAYGRPAENPVLEEAMDRNVRKGRPDTRAREDGVVFHQYSWRK
ncbi:ABC transporter ATP-binding protein, partial [Candidatus Peregrinibacteria bacterium]|nr:ABC transporter ATP-binding protein [Candidatus Peregrinibacteria bacterium]